MWLWLRVHIRTSGWLAIAFVPSQKKKKKNTHTKRKKKIYSKRYVRSGSGSAHKIVEILNNYTSFRKGIISTSAVLMILLGAHRKMPKCRQGFCFYYFSFGYNFFLMFWWLTKLIESLKLMCYRLYRLCLPWRLVYFSKFCTHCFCLSMHSHNLNTSDHKIDSLTTRKCKLETNHWILTTQFV